MTSNSDSFAADQTVDERGPLETAENPLESGIVQVVRDLLEEDENQGIGSSTGISELPSFAELGFEEHQVDLAPGASGQVLHEQSLRESENWPALAQFLIERAEETQRASDAAARLVEASSIYEKHLGDLGAAHTILAKALEIDPMHEDAANHLEVLTERTALWAEWIQSLSDSADALRLDEPVRAGELRIRQACALAKGLGDADGAFRVLSDVEVADTERVASYLDTLESFVENLAHITDAVALSQRIGDLDRTVRLMSQAIAKSQSASQRAEYHQQIAQIEATREDAEVAAWHWREALRLDPGQHDARDALIAIYKQQGDYHSAVQLLEEAGAHTEDAERRAQYACDAAQIYSHSLGEKTRATELFASALQIQPGHRAASLPVVERYYERERWQELAPVLDSLLVSDFVEGLGGEDLTDLYGKAATCSAALGQHEKALGFFRQCLKLEPTLLKALEGSAHCELALGEFSEAIETAARAIAERERLGHDAPLLVSMFAVSAEAHRDLGQQEQAVALYTRCARHEDVESMRALSALHSLRGEHHQAVSLQLRIAEMQPTEVRVQMLCDTSDTLANHIGDLEAAIDLCWQALSLQTDSRAALHRLAVLYTQNEEWNDAIKTIVRMAELERSAPRSARYLQTAAQIASEAELTHEAVVLFERAMDGYGANGVMAESDELRAACFECFEQSMQVLTRVKDWREVERSYRKMIHRLEPGDPEVASLWAALGQIYKDKLGDKIAAIESLEVAASLIEGSLTHHRTLATLCEGAGDDQLDKAIAHRRLLLEAEPDEAEHYRALRSLYVRTQRMDRAWCICRALCSMGVAEKREVAFYRSHSPAEILWPSRPLNSEMWSRVRDPRVDPNISRVFGLVSEVVAQQCTQPLELARLSEQAGPQFDQLRQLFSAASYAFGLPAFDCLIDSNRQTAIALLNLQRDGGLQPTFVLGEGLYRGRAIAQIASGLGRVLALGRRSYYLRLALPNLAELAAAFYAGVRLVHPNVAVPQGLRVRVETFQAALAKDLHQTWKQKLQQAAGAFLQSDVRFDLEVWCEGADATARHAALLLSGDLEFGLAEIREELGINLKGVEPARIALRLASVSEAHMSLREELGLAAI